LPLRQGFFGAERLRHGVGHGAVCKADDGAPPSIGLDMTQQPDGRRAGVGSENRIFGGILTDQCRRILQMLK
jgi:hypothetical protein